MTNSEEDPPSEPPALLYPLAVVYCLLAAVGYTLANVALRRVSDLDPIFVTAVKAVPTMLFMAPAVIRRRIRHVPLVPKAGTLPSLVLGCVVGQFVGNCAFQYSLGIVGLALAVPICLGTMVIGGAVCGRMILGETVTKRTVISIVVLIVAALVLSLGSGDSAINTALTPWQIASGVLAVSASGVAYAFFGTMVRRSLLRGMAVSTTMFVSGVIGTFGLSAIAYGWIGSEGLMTSTADQWLSMLAAGMCNLFAFFVLTVALQVVSVVVVNLLNVTQVAMAAVAGVLIFQEQITTSMIVGISLTAVGLMVLGKRRRKQVLPCASAVPPSEIPAEED